MNDLVNLNSEVEINQKDLLLLDRTWIEKIKELSKKNISGKYRTCIHKSEEDNVHEMLIALTSNTYIRPHKHRINGESLQFIEGEAIAIIFYNDGTINQAFKVGKSSSDYPFYYSMAKAVYHMILVKSDYLIFKETARGPFIRDDTLFPDWAPDGEEEKKLKDFIVDLETRLKERGL